MITLCKACGTSYEVADSLPEHCNICQDERQSVPATGQEWVDFAALCASHTNKWQQHDSALLSIRTVPGFAIDQRAFILRTSEGNILWDCIATLDDATKMLIKSLGGLKAIAISHPHYYTTMQDWADEFNAPIYLHANDRKWVMRDSPWIKFWNGDTLELTRDVSVIRLGGHFAGGCVLHWARDEGVVLSGDIVQVTPGAHAVSFMWSYPKMLPLSAATVSDITHRLSTVKFKQLYGAFEGKDITKNADDIVQRSGEKYVSCLK
ncbi:Metallo-beta-lactamase superfamily [Citrobacter freundii]|nr:Metallo-beta-lactamase superfamily [Citrobacter freundii]SUX73859.1 Metallo-beta-lactamase superfamily [Citrobacter freundii]